MEKKATKKAIIFLCLGIIIAFNAYLHRGELSITNEVNDNTFQFALVDEAKVIWQQIIAGKLSPFYLFDSFNERWNEGFALSNYYSHLPQAVVALPSVLLNIDSFKLFTVVKFLLLILLPVPFFLGARLIGLSYLYSILTAYLSHTIFTDGLYGIDMTSFLWRGWGLSSQLIAIFLLPLTFAYTFSYLERKKNLAIAVLLNFLLASSHSGIFLMTALSYPVLLIFHFEDIKPFVLRFLQLVIITGFFLAYFFIPFFLQADYRNYSYWDPLWKFNSFGIVPILTWFFNGAIFDSGRLSIITLLVIFGFFYSLIDKNRFFRYVALLFIIYCLFFIGRSPFGILIDRIPGFSEFHLHRFIVMVQFMGILLAARLMETVGSLPSFAKLRTGLPPPWWGSKQTHPTLFNLIIVGFLIIFGSISIYFLEKPLIKYATDNNHWIGESNQRFVKDITDYRKLVTKLKSLPDSRVYSGRPGNWGREFKVGDSPVYMMLSRDGFKTIGLAPESWSPNSELDQFFGDNDETLFNLYNARYAVFPKDFTVPKFARLIEKFGKYQLCEIKTDGWFTTGMSNLVLTGKKTDFVNITHLWLNSQMYQKQDYPTILFPGDNTNFPKKYYYSMLDINSFKDNNGKVFTLWERNPMAINFGKNDLTIKEIREHSSFNHYEAVVSVARDCLNCVVILKQTFHPNWQIKVNGRDISAYPVFPFYIGIPMDKAGEYRIEATYRPNSLKTALLISAVIVLAGFVFNHLKKSKL